MKKLLLTCLAISIATAASKAAVSLPDLVSDHMLIQRNAPVRIWGHAAPGETVTVTMFKQKPSTVADAKGNWQVWLMPMASQKAVSMTVSGSNSITVNDVLIGEVWVASGQSNMEWEVQQSNNAEEEIKNSDYPDIRLFVVAKGVSAIEKQEVKGKWERCSPSSSASFSAAAYFFGRDMYKHLKVPVGLIECDWSATSCEPWVPLATIESDARLQYVIDSRPYVQVKRAQVFQDSVEKLHPGASAPPAGMQIAKTQPGTIFNYMVAPLSLYTIKGIIWYQGEQNAYEKVSYPYRYLFPDMIQAWRNRWGQGDFPFIFVQLSAFTKHPYWPVLRESQLETTKLKNTAMVVSIDVGDSTNAHFKNKQAIGQRLFLAASHLAYGENVEYSGPAYRQMTVEGNKLRLWMDHAKGLKTNDGKAPAGFAIAGADGKQHPATAVIEGESIVLYSPDVQKPITARYAFMDWPECNLVNGAGLPASPFRTDPKNGL